jgi:hypothetical protein
MTKAYNKMQSYINTTVVLIEILADMLDTYNLFQIIDIVVESLK